MNKLPVKDSYLAFAGIVFLAFLMMTMSLLFQFTKKDREQGLIDFTFWRIRKSHTWLDDTSLYLLESKAGMYAIVVEYPDDRIVSLASAFDWQTALSNYNLHKSHLMKDRTEWYSEILNNGERS